MKEWHTSFGVNGMQQQNKNKGGEVLIPEYSLFDFGAFVYFQRFYKDGTISGGLRFDNRSVDGKSFSKAPKKSSKPLPGISPTYPVALE